MASAIGILIQQYGRTGDEALNFRSRARLLRRRRSRCRRTYGHMRNSQARPQEARNKGLENSARHQLHAWYFLTLKLGRANAIGRPTVKENTVNYEPDSAAVFGICLELLSGMGCMDFAHIIAQAPVPGERLCEAAPIKRCIAMAQPDCKGKIDEPVPDDEDYDSKRRHRN